jgi:RimJ/RimL family protein N-acetyltransferase
MGLNFRAVRCENSADAELLVRWENDLSIRHFVRPFRDEMDFVTFDTVEKRWAYLKEKFGTQDGAGANPAGTASGKQAGSQSSGVSPEVGSALRNDDFQRWMMEFDGITVGNCSLMINPPHIRSEGKRVAWIGIAIGEASARGRGLGSKVLAFLEERAREYQADEIQAGVFEMNTPSLRLFEKNGYVRLRRYPRFTWWNGRYWADMRFVKKLNLAE